MARQTQEDIWMADACIAIRGNKGLQYFLQNFFEQAGVYSAPPTEPELISRAAGQRDIALDVKSLLDEYDPLLYHELQIARIEYLTQTQDDEEDNEDGR